jgi:hypothetical protein
MHLFFISHLYFDMNAERLEWFDRQFARQWHIKCFHRNLKDMLMTIDMQLQRNQINCVFYAV